MANRTIWKLDGEWRFQVDRDEKGEARGYHRPGYDPKDWLKVRVPGNWNTFLPELFGWAGHGWYRRTFQVPAGLAGGRVHLRFDGANYETTVWLNGHELGQHRGGFDPFVFDVTDLLDPKGENTLSVRADNWSRIGRVPNSLAGWWNYGGIYRSVKLVALPALRVADVFVRAEPGSDGPAPLSVDVTILNESTAPAGVSLQAMVKFAGQAVALDGAMSAPALTVAAGDAARLSLAAAIPQARLWSPDTPNLYTLHLSLQAGGATIDELDVRFGVRKFEVRGTEFYLNGESVMLTGFDRHEEYPGCGRVDPGGMLEADLKLIKELGGNMVRMHYQAHPALYELADEMGLLVYAEIPAWQVGVKDLAEFNDPVVIETAEIMLRTLIRELKNHPSVVIWSVGNECATRDVESRPFIGRLAELARSLDSTRPVAYAGMTGLSEQCFDLVDMLSMHVYRGLRTAETAEFLDKAHALAPDKPLFITEFGHESALGLHGEGYGTEEEHAAVLERKWELFRERRAFIPGAIIWCLADYWHMPMAPDFKWLNRYYFCHGVTTLARKPKLAAAAVKKMWTS